MPTNNELDGESPDPVGTKVPPLLRKLIFYTLRLGVGVSATLILIGLGLLLAGSVTNFVSATDTGTSFSGSGLVAGLARGRPEDILLLGFLVLIATPLVRVVLSAGLFAAARDRPFTALTVAVLVLLAVSVIVGAVP